MMNEKQATLILENGTEFFGTSIGNQGETIGTLNFTTAMVGYQEAITDKANYGVMLTHTFPTIGNYGVNKFCNESNTSYLNGYVVREICEEPSNFRCEGTLNDFLIKNNVVGICDIDTRKLTKIIRENGEMNAMITTNEITDKEAVLAKIKAYKITDAIKNTSITAKKVYPSDGAKKHSVAILDVGAKASLINAFVKKSCDVTILPFDTNADEIVDKYDFLIISDGAGNPEENKEVIATIAKLMSTNMKIIGIGLGHLLMALASGQKVSKLTYGHRGANVPVLDMDSKKTYITSQNHGYVVDEKSLGKNTKVIFQNANDKTIEGLSYSENAYSVAFTPDYEFSMTSTSFVFDKLQK